MENASAKFQYTFFDAFGQNNNIPDVPITPFPTLFTSPIYRPANNTIELTVSNFFYDDPKTRTQVPLDVYLANLGPLRQRVYQASPPGLLTTTAFAPSVVPPPGMSPDDPSLPQGSGQRFMSAGPLHTIVMVEMPSLLEVMKALDEDALPTVQDASVGGSQSHSNDPSTSNAQHDTRNNPVLPPPSISGRSLPLLFIRSSDGVGYHSGRTVACENVFQTMDLGPLPPPSPNSGVDTSWLTGAQNAVPADGGLHGWTLRVI